METPVSFSSREGRRLVRQQLNGNHGVKATLESGSLNIKITLLDISSLGFAMLISKENLARVKLTDQVTLKVSPLIGVQYRISGIIIDQQVCDDGLKISAVIDHACSKGHGVLTPIELVGSDVIRGQFTHPFFYKQNHYFDIESLSAQGFYLTNIDAGCVLLSGMRLVCRLGLSEKSQIVEGVVSDVTFTSNNRLRCFVKLNRLTEKTEQEISQYCFHYLKKTPRDLRRSGFRSYYVKELVQYKFVETQQEYEDILLLRRRNYAAVRKVKPDAPLKSLSYFFDRYSRILVVYHQGTAIGTATMIFSNGGSQPMELEVLLPQEQFAQLPSYQHCFEVAALCLDKGYRDTDILHGLFEHIYKNAMMFGRNHIVISSDKYLAELYKSIGFQETEFNFVQPKYRNLNMKVLVMTDLTTKWGKGMHPVDWWRIWGNVSLYLYRRRVIRYSLAERFRIYGSCFLYHCSVTSRPLLDRLKNYYQAKRSTLLVAVK
ncbi:N-acyl amino acid synthase FeeM domain-containing protein [Ketobacter sp.]